VLKGGSVNTKKLGVKTGDQTYNDAVTLEADTTLTTVTAGNVKFDLAVNSDAAGTPRDLTINTAGSGETRFNGAVGGTFELGSLTTNADGTTVLKGGSVNTKKLGVKTGNQTYNDLVTLEADTTLTAGVGSTVEFNSTVDAKTAAGEFLTVNTGTAGKINFFGDVGTLQELKSLTADTNLGQIEFRNELTPTGKQIIKASDLVSLNVSTPAYTPGTNMPQAATIYKRNGDLDITIDGAAGVLPQFVMGDYEKMTVVGNLSITANGPAKLHGDIVALQTLTVKAASIEYKPRGGTNILTWVNSTTTDEGQHFIATKITISPTPVPNPLQLQFASATGTDFAGERKYGPIDQKSLFLGGRVLDLTPKGPVNANVAEVLAGASNQVESVVEHGNTALTQAQTDMLQGIGVYPRDLAPDELMAMLMMGFVIDDYGYNAGRPKYVAIPRLSSAVTALVKEAYEGVFPAGNQRRVAELKAAFQKPWDKFRESADAATDRQTLLKQFVEFLKSGKEDAAMDAARKIKRLFDAIALLGLTQGELNLSKRTILSRFTPDGMETPEFQSVLEGLFGEPAPTGGGKVIASTPAPGTGTAQALAEAE
jgi:hypothetical protein